MCASECIFGRNEAAAASYTKAIDSLAKLPDDAEVLDVKAAKIESYTGRADANAAQEKYEEVLPDYDALIDMGEDKTADRDAILRAMSLAKSKAGDLNSSINWLDEVNHTDYAASIQLTEAENILKQAAEQAKADGVKAYDKIKETLSTDEAKLQCRTFWPGVISCAITTPMVRCWRFTQIQRLGQM